MRYWEDISVGDVARFGRHRLDADEIAQFGARFAPPAYAGPNAGNEHDAVPGMMLCCVIMRLLVDHFLIDLASRGSPGVDRINWPAPARAGDVVGLRTEVLASRALKSHSDMGLIQQHVLMHNQDRRIVAQMWSHVLIARREEAS